MSHEPRTFFAHYAKRFYFGAAALFIVALVAFVDWGGLQMKRLGVVIYVTPEVMEKGAVVTIMTRLVPVEEFEARYPVPETPPDVAGAPEAERQWYGTATGPVNIVYFEIPDDTSYTYRFRAVPENGQAAATVLERVLTIGGTTLDADGNNMGYVRFGLNRMHEIDGDLINLRLVANDPAEEFGIDPLTCPETGGVRVCVPDENALMERAIRLSRTNGIPAGHPWGQ